PELYTLSLHDALPILLHIRVRQEDAPKEFMMPVPLLIQFADSTHALVRVNVRGPVTEGQLRVPAEPTSLELNPLSSVLADDRGRSEEHTSELQSRGHL